MTPSLQIVLSAARAHANGHENSAEILRACEDLASGRVESAERRVAVTNPGTVTSPYLSASTRPAGYSQQNCACVSHDPLREKVKELNAKLQCNCDLDNWEPEADTGHSWVCRIHRIAKGMAELQS